MSLETSKEIKVGAVCGKIWAKLGPVCEKSKETGIINKFFFHILHGVYLLKQKVVVVQILERKFKANTTRNATFEKYV